MPFPNGCEVYSRGPVSRNDLVHSLGIADGEGAVRGERDPFPN